ncbi:MAG: FapA family protein [Geobacteraceae bacterium]|nr:FapA family protein [Geobacteraceae bacterium]
MSDQGTQTQENKPDGQRFYHAQTGYQLILSLSKDEMECRAHLEVKADGAPPTRDELLGYLAADGITTGIDEEALPLLLREARPGKSANGLLAAGIQPVLGDDGRLAFSFDTSDQSPADTTADEDPEKRQIDFRAVQKFINVDADQEIGRILPPTYGTPGKTVRGKPVPSEPGKPLLLKLGQNVRSGGDNNDILFAEIHGRVKQEGDTIHVVEEYVVDGDVDFSIGNIRFNGYVEVRGDVLDGFQVSASKGLKITGNVGACRLISHGNIEFCGMDGQGQGKGSILCGGTITAHFIHDSVIECWGNMLVDVELRNCSIHCRGSLTTGVLAGGDCVTLAGIEAKKLGAPSAVKTVVHSGVDYHDLDRLHILFEQLDQLQQEIAKTKDLQELTALTEKKQQLSRIIVDVRSHRPAGSNPKINIKDRIHEGVTIYLGDAVEEFAAELSGPISLIENSRDGGLRRLSLSSLDIPASDLEKAWLENDELERQERLKQEAAEREAAEAAEAQKALDEAEQAEPAAESSAPD